MKIIITVQPPKSEWKIESRKGSWFNASYGDGRGAAGGMFEPSQKLIALMEYLNEVTKKILGKTKQISRPRKKKRTGGGNTGLQG
jgi:hypothetical protein